MAATYDARQARSLHEESTLEMQSIDSGLFAGRKVRLTAPGGEARVGGMSVPSGRLQH